MSRKIINLIGKNFGKLIVLELDSINKKQGALWKCICDCGNPNIIIVQGTNLRNNHTKSCGCLKTGSNKKYNYRRKYEIKGESCFNTLFLIYKNGAKKRNLSFELTSDEFEIITLKNCYYCGCSPKKEIKKKNKNGKGQNYIYNGIDRIDSTKGYIIDNIVPCCSDCNYAKRSMTQLEFKNWIIKVYNNYINEIIN